jgi:hypothetical protein
MEGAVVPNYQTPEPERAIVAFVISGTEVFRVTADNVVQSEPDAASEAFEGVAKLKAAAALMQLSDEYHQYPQELRRIAREMAAEGMRILASASEPKPVMALSA